MRLRDQRLHAAAFAGLMLLAVFLRFYLIGAKTLWLDEAFSVWVARHGLWEQWRWLIRIDQHPPLYYGLLRGWIGLFGDGPAAVRALSALCSSLAAPLFYGAARRLFDGPTGLVALFILAVSPFHVRFAQETRMYGLLTLEVAAALFFLSTVLTRRDAPRRHWMGLAVAQAAIMLTHNTAAVYFPAAVNLAVAGLVWLDRRTGSGKLDVSGDFLCRWVRYQGLALLLWSPWAVPFVIQAVGVDRQFWLWPPTPGMVYDTFRNFNFAFLPGWLPVQPLWMLLYGLFFLLGLVALGRRPRRLLLLLSLLAVPHLLALLVSLRRPIYYDRTLIWTTLPYYLLLAVGVRALTDRTRWALAFAPATLRPPRLPARALYGLQTGALALILVLSGLSLGGYYWGFQKEGWDQAAAYVAEHVGPDDVIVFNATWVQIPFEYYYRHYGKDTELRGLPVDLFDRGVLEPIMAESDVPYLHELVRGRERVWLVYSHDWYTDPKKIIPRELARDLRVVDRRKFPGLQVIRYERQE